MSSPGKWTYFQQNGEKFSYEWRINDIGFYLSYLKNNPEDNSPRAFVSNDVEFYLQFKCEAAKHIKLNTIFTRKNLKENCLMKYKVSIFDNDRKSVVKEYKYSNIEFRPNLYSSSTEIMFNMFSMRAAANNLYNDELTILCEGSLQMGYEQKVFHYGLLDDIALCFDDPKYCDITLCVCGKLFLTHKFLLAAHSSVFQEKIKSMIESDVLIINDVSPDIFQEILRFIYTGEVSNLDIFAIELFVAADDYGLKRLKSMCAKHICNELSFENCSQIFLLADLHTDILLRAKCINFINMNAEHVMITNGWKSMLKTNPHFVREIFKIAAEEHGFWETTPPTVPKTSIHTDECVAYTQINVEKFKCQWTIKNFNEPHLVTVSTSEIRDLKADLKIIVLGNCLSFYLCLYEPEALFSKWKFGIVNPVERYERVCQFSGNRGGIEKFILLDKCYDLIVDNLLIISCEGTVLTRKASISSQLISSKFLIPKCQLASDLINLLKTPKFTDVTLEVSGKEFYAHKLILSKRSSVFQAMFESKLEGNKRIRLVINDISEEVFREMMLFIYTGNVPNIKNMVKDLSLVAQNYSLERLLLICQKENGENTPFKNTLKTSLIYFNDETCNVRDSTPKFIIRNAEEVLETSEWTSGWAATIERGIPIVKLSEIKD